MAQEMRCVVDREYRAPAYQENKTVERRRLSCSLIKLRANKNAGNNPGVARPATTVQRYETVLY